MQTNVTLPKWLDDYIFNELGAKYCRSNSDMTVIDWDKSDILNYLGTYFPRSYAESYCIFSNYFANHQEEWRDKTTLSVFDFGCGTGGEIIGLATAIEEQLPHITTIQVCCFDGNQPALRLLERIVKRAQNEFKIVVDLKPIPYHITDFYDMGILKSVLNERFDIIMTFKAICEFVTKDCFERKNAYLHFIETFLDRLKDDGIFLIEDVSTLNPTSKKWLPIMMDSALEQLSLKANDANEGYNFQFNVTHSAQQYDRSKVTWRIIGKQ